MSFLASAGKGEGGERPIDSFQECGQKEGGFIKKRSRMAPNHGRSVLSAGQPTGKKGGRKGTGDILRVERGTCEGGPGTRDRTETYQPWGGKGKERKIVTIILPPRSGRVKGKRGEKKGGPVKKIPSERDRS